MKDIPDITIASNQQDNEDLPKVEIDNIKMFNIMVEMRRQLNSIEDNQIAMMRILKGMNRGVIGRKSIEIPQLSFIDDEAVEASEDEEEDTETTTTNPERDETLSESSTPKSHVLPSRKRKFSEALFSGKFDI